jgi:quercetin dioxygenase-like cupin family protein
MNEFLPRTSGEKSMRVLTALVAISVIIQSALPCHGDGPDKEATGKSGLKLETLFRTALAGVADTEVIVSRVTMPPDTALPKHWHPGEEFAYILEGSATLWQKGKEDIVCNAGDVVMVPLNQVHTAITTEQVATMLVFRVHEQGKPERIPADGD